MLNAYILIIRGGQIYICICIMYIYIYIYKELQTRRVCIESTQGNNNNTMIL